MSPARSNRSRRQPQVHKRDRREIVKAGVVSAVIVGATALLIWMLRPGPNGIPATGGIMNRQPRATWLIVSALAVGGVVLWFVLRRSRRARRRAKSVLVIAFVLLLIGTVGVGLIWPGGLLRHDVAPQAQPTPDTTPDTTPTTPTTPPRATGATGASGASGTSGASGATGASGTTGPPTTPVR